MPFDWRTRLSIAATSRGPSQSTFEDFESGIEEFHDLGSGVTFDMTVLRGRPHGSGGLVETRFGVVAIWRDGQIRRATNYKDLDEALAVAERLAEERR